jgi:hypothetical protein
MAMLSGRPRATGATAVIGAIVAGVIALLTGCSQQPPPQSAAVQSMTRMSEADFQRSIPPSDLDGGERESEWRAARSDHHVIANAILACKNRFEEIASMSPSVFSALLLDLTPRGSHFIPGVASAAADKTTPARQSGGLDGGFVKLAAAADAGGVNSGADRSDFGQPEPIDKAVTPAPNRDTIALTATEWYLLAMSDSIARARLSATAARADAFDPAKKIWLWTLLIGGLATFFVTLQAKMTPPAAPAESGAPGGATSPSEPRFWRRLRSRLPHQTRSFVYQFIVIGAIALSITGTSLNALKQYFDPTRALVQNELALMDLRKLHQSVIQAASCDGGQMKIANEKQEADWAAGMQKAIGRIVSPYSTAAAAGGAPEAQ